MNDKRLQILKIVLLMLASGFFLYNGFSILFNDETKTPSEQNLTVTP